MTRLGGAARLLSFVVVAWLLTITPVRSEVATVEADAPIVRVQALQGNVTIRTWDRAYVQIEGDPATYSVEHRVNRIPALLPPAPISPGRIEGPDGLIELPAESFVVSTLPAGPRDLVQLKGTQVGTLTLTVPYNSPVVGVILGRGSLTVNDYRGGTLIAHVRNGRMWLRNFGGDAFVQILRGPLLVTDSSFGRLRARAALGPMIFERCSARQIEATNVNGAIVYDRGSFEPGLARFDSLKGDVAIGVASGAQLDGRAASGGRVYTLFDQHAQVNAREGAASALVDGGGPTVNATSGSGNVYLYDGSLRARNRVPAEWQPPLGVLHGNPRNEEAPQSGPPARSAAPHRVVAPSPHFAGHR